MSSGKWRQFCLGLNLLSISQATVTPRVPIPYIYSRGTSSSRCLQMLTVLGHQLASWWRHQMETFSALLAICAGNSPVRGEFSTQRPVTRSFGVFFDIRLDKRLSKQSWGWWFETLSRPFWRHSNDCVEYEVRPIITSPAGIILPNYFSITTWRQLKWPTRS